MFLFAPLRDHLSLALVSIGLTSVFYRVYFVCLPKYRELNSFFRTLSSSICHYNSLFYFSSDVTIFC
jgi:hypothetical protein